MTLEPTYDPDCRHEGPCPDLPKPPPLVSWHAQKAIDQRLSKAARLSKKAAPRIIPSRKFGKDRAA